MPFKSLPLLLFFISFKLSAQHDNYVNYTINDGLPSNTVYCVEQDDQGFMWFGTDAGLSRYDGYEFTNYTLNDGLPDTEILKFFKDSLDRIWFYTLNGKVGYIYNNTIYSSKNTDWLKELEFNRRITSIIEANQKLYFAAVGSEYKVLDGIKVYSNRIESHSTISLCACNNKVYLFTKYAGNYTIEEANESYIVKKVNNGNGFGYEVTYPLCYKGNIYAFDISFQKTNRLLQFSNNLFIPMFLDIEDRILNIEVHNDQLYTLSKKRILRIDTKSNLVYPIPSLKFNASLHTDLEGNTWYTSTRFGIRFQPKKKVRINKEYIDIDQLATINDSLFIAHNKKEISIKSRSNSFESYLSFEKPNSVNFIVKSPSNQIVIGRNNSTYFDKVSSKISSALSVSFTDSVAYFGSRSRVKTNIDSIPPPPSVLGNVRSILAIDEDSILIGTDHGLLTVHGDSLKYSQAYRQFSKIETFQTRINKIIHSNDKIIFATGGNGIIIYLNADSLNQVSKEDGLISNIVTDVIIKDSTFWILTPKGINKLTSTHNRWDISTLDSSYGLSSIQARDMEYFNDSIYLATNVGLFSFSAAIDLAESNTFTFFINQVLVDNKMTLESNFDSDINSVQIEFKALAYRNHGSLSYQYQLITDKNPISDQKWIDTDFNQVNFLGLNPNEYTFWVRAKTKNSEWSTPITYQFNIKPAIWQELWFQVSVILILIVSIVIYFNRRSNRKLNEKNLEKAKINAELTALKAQINPHFLFNVLNSIQSFILDNEKDIAQEYLVKYGRLMRMVLDYSDHLLVSLNTEIEMLKLYTDLEKLRLKKGFDFEVILSDYFVENSIDIPSMIIQPFVENAVWHGLSPLNEKGNIIIEVNHIDDHIQIEVIDNGVGFEIGSENSNNHVSSGVRLVRERLNLLGNKNSFKNHIDIKSAAGKGTRVAISFSDNLIV